MKSIYPYTASYKSLAVLMIVILLVTALPVKPVYAATFTVTKTIDTNDGACDADCSLREAVVAANATAGADIVTLASGSTYTLSIAGAGENASATGDLDVTDATGLTINTSGAGTATIDANDIDRILDVRPGASLTMNNITITDGSATTNGGGLLVEGTATITGGGFTDNLSAGGSDGGAIYVTIGTLSINGSTFSNNTASDDGGAIYLLGGTTTITGATFTGNTGTDIGGAIRIDADNTSISNTTFLNNTSNSVNTNPGVGGGAIFINETGNNTTITLSTFNGNSTSRANSARGGAIFNEGTNVVIANSTFTGNTATDTVAGVAGDVAQGGAIFQDDTGPDPSLTLYNVTMSGNSTGVNGLGTASGGSIYRNTATGTITLANTIVANGTPDNCAGSAITDGGNNIDFNGGGCGLANTADPDLGALTGSPAYFPLNVGSPAIDAGSNAVCANAFVNNQSQNGVTRPQPAAGSCDIGSFELSDPTPPTLLSFTRQTPATTPTNADTLVFRATFNEDVTNVSTGDFAVNGTTTATVTGVATVSASVYDITVSGGDLAGFNGVVGLDLAGGQNITDLIGNALPAGEPATDETYTVDNAGPTVTINQAIGQADPTGTSPISFTIVFSEAVSGFDASDVTLGGTAGATTAVVSGGPTTYTVDVSGMTGDGTVTATVNASAVTDALGNPSSASTSIDNTVTYDTSGPLVSIGAPSVTTTTVGPVDFPITVTSATTINLVAANVTLNTTGTATGTISVTNGTTANPTVTISAITGSGTIGISIAAGIASDAASNTSPAAGPSATFIVDNGGPVVTASIPANGASVTGPTQLTVTFNEDISPATGNNAANYLLLNDSGDGFDDTPILATCLTGSNPNGGNDLNIPVNTATFNNNGGGGPFVTTLGINGGTPLPLGVYRLYVCGTTSIEDLVGNELNNGAADTIIQFTVVAGTAGGGGTQRTNLIPATGFAQGEVTSLASQPANKAYTATNMWIEIPSLKVRMSIVGVPQTRDGWDVTWLGRDAGWLNGSAFPTWNGNSVLTGHVWDAVNKPGPFALLKDLKYGDQVRIHAFGQVFIYEIRENKLISPTNLSTMLKHEDKSWLTLITCEDYKEKSQTYSSRRMVRAVLISVTAEK